MKVFFNRVPKDQPWGGGNQFVIAMVHYLRSHGHEVTFQLEQGVDKIFMIDPRPGDIGYSVHHIKAYKQMFPSTQVIHRVNECDQRKGTSGMDAIQLAAMKEADDVVFISAWLQKYYEARGFKGKSHVVYNGCNLEHFRPEKRSPAVQEPLSLLDPNPVLSSAKVKVVTHHWSDNWLKGFDIYAEIDRYLQKNPEAFEFTYVGRYNGSYIPQVTTLVKPLHGLSLGAELRSHDVYVTASRWEPCGMHHIEGAASGLPVLYHAESGGINEKCAEHGLEFKDFQGFLKALDEVKNNLNMFQQRINYKTLDIGFCCEQFYHIITG